MVREGRAVLNNVIGKRVALALLAMMVPFGACRAENEPARITNVAPLTICNIGRQFSQGGAQRLTIEAEYLTDRRERALLHDRRCPRIVVIPYESSAVERDRGYEEFTRLLYANPLDLRLLRMGVVVHGTIRPTGVRPSGTRTYRMDILRYVQSSELR